MNKKIILCSMIISTAIFADDNKTLIKIKNEAGHGVFLTAQRMGKWKGTASGHKYEGVLDPADCAIMSLETDETGFRSIPNACANEKGEVRLTGYQFKTGSPYIFYRKVQPIDIKLNADKPRIIKVTRVVIPEEEPLIQMVEEVVAY